MEEDQPVTGYGENSQDSYFKRIYNGFLSIVRGIILGIAFGIVGVSVLLVVYRNEIEAFLTSACEMTINDQLQNGVCRYNVEGQTVDCLDHRS